MRVRAGGDAKKSAASRFKLRLHLSGREGSDTHVSAPPLNPSLWPGGENTAPHGLPYASPAPQPAAPPPTTSSLRPGMACKAWRDLAGPLARGLTSGLGKLAF